MNDTDTAEVTAAYGQYVTEVPRSVDDQMEVVSTNLRCVGDGVTFAGHTGLYAGTHTPRRGAVVATTRACLP